MTQVVLVKLVHLPVYAYTETEVANFVFYTAPISDTAPSEAPPNLPSSPSALAPSKKVKHPSLILVIGLGAVILIIAVITVVMLCFCVSRREKHTEPFKETGMRRVVSKCVFICSFSSFMLLLNFLVCTMLISL